MSKYTANITNEAGQPLIGVDVEAIDAATGQIVGVSATDKGGVATFSGLADGLNLTLNPRVTRRSGTGRVNVKPNPAQSDSITPERTTGIISNSTGLPSWFKLVDEGGQVHRVEIDADTEVKLIIQNLPQSDPGNGLVWLSDT